MTCLSRCAQPPANCASRGDDKASKQLCYRRMKKLFKWLAFPTLALVIAVAVLLFNPSLIKSPLENYLSNLTGYPISLEGELAIGVGTRIEITAANVSLSAADWSSHQQLISVGYLKLVLETGSLFKDLVVLDSLQIDDLQVNLETTANGEGNWKTSKPAQPKNDAGNGATRIVFNAIRINNSRLRYLNGETSFEHRLHITSLEQQQHADGMLHINLDGSYNDKPLTFNGSLGKYADLLAGNNISYDGSGSFGTLKVESSGFIDDLLQPRRPRFDLLIEGPDIDEVTTAFGLDDLGSGQFSLQAKGHELDGQYEVSIYGDIGDLSLNASALVSDLSKMEEFDLDLAFNGPNLGAFTRVFGIKKWPDKPFRLKARAKRLGGTLNVPNLTLTVGGSRLELDALLSNFPHLDAGRVKLSISGNDIEQFRQLLGISGIASGPFKIRGKLDISSDSVELLEVEIESSLGHVILSGSLGASPEYIGSKLHLHLDGENAHFVMSAFNVDALPDQPFNMDARVEVVENGLLIERGVLVTSEDERLELGGLISFKPGSVGTSLDVSFHGKHLNRILRRLVGDTEVPDHPYALSGRIRVLENGFQLDRVRAAFAGIELVVEGLINKGPQPLSTGLDFDLSGKNLSALGEFKIIGDSLDMFIPGQAYKAVGRFSGNSDGWHFENVVGQIGQTNLEFSGLISSKPKWVGSNILFSFAGPDAHSLLIYEDESELPAGAFDTSGQITLTDRTVNFKDFKFENEKISGTVQLDLGWPLSRDIDASFDINIQGDDIRHLLPKTDSFEPQLAAFKINASGKKQGALISIQRANINIGDLQLALHGELGEDAAGENAMISFSAISPDLSRLGTLSGAFLPDAPLDIRADFTGNANRFKLNNIVGTLGRTDVSGMLDVSLLGEKPSITAIVKSVYFDIRPYTNQSGSDQDDVNPDKPNRLIPPTPLPLDALAAADIELRLDVAELRHKADSLKNLSIDAVLRSGSLVVEEFAFHGPRGKVNAAFSITPTTSNKATVKLRLRADELVLNLTGQAEEKLDQAPKIDIFFNATGHGGNLQEVAGSINGSFYLGSRGGVMEGVDLSILDTFILDEIFSLIMPKSDVDDDLNLTCAAAILNITDGLVKTDPAVAFTTSKITLVSKGSVDLKTEEMKLNFNATPNNALKLSASELFNPYILVGGTLAKPAVGLDPAKVILHGGAAIGTAGLSILAKGLIDRVSTTMPICEDMLEAVQNKQ